MKKSYLGQTTFGVSTITLYISHDANQAQQKIYIFTIAITNH
jgi:hypothetical protein